MAQQPEKAWTFFDLYKMKLFGKSWVEGDRKQSPTLTLKISADGNPRFMLYMNKGGNAPGNTIALDPIIFYYLLEAMDYIANKSEADRITMPVKSNWVNGKRLDQPVIVSNVSIGRDATGVIFLSILIKGDSAPAVFEFNPSFFGNLLASNGEELSLGLASILVAKGWARLVRDVLGPYYAIKLTNPELGKEPNKYPAKNNHSSNNRGYSNNPSLSSASFDVEDDIPF